MSVTESGNDPAKSYALQQIQRHRESYKEIDITKLSSTYRAQLVSQDEVNRAIDDAQRHNRNLIVNRDQLRKKAGLAIKLIMGEFDLTYKDLPREE